VVEYRQAAEVLAAVQETHTSLCDFIDKAQHLSAIHSADRRVWPECVATMLDAGWAVKDTEHWTAQG
jgi:hypothetical protein